MITGMSWTQRYLTMDPEDILKESLGNFSLAREDILSLKTREQLGLNQADPNTPLPFFMIKTRTEKFKFLLPRSYDAESFTILKKWVTPA